MHQKGLTLMELMMAMSITVLFAVVLGGLFLGQSRGYKDINDRSQLQSTLRLASQTIKREITNTGAGLENTRHNFAMAADAFTFAYIDFSGRHCNTGDTVTVKYELHVSGDDRSLRQTIKCNSNGTPTVTELAKKADDFALSFRYLDQSGGVTAIASAVRTVEFDLTLTNQPPGMAIDKSRLVLMQVNLKN